MVFESSLLPFSPQATDRSRMEAFAFGTKAPAEEGLFSLLLLQPKTKGFEIRGFFAYYGNIMQYQSKIRTGGDMPCHNLVMLYQGQFE